MGQSKSAEMYYPQVLCKAYFNWCKANDNRQTFELMHEFICEVQGLDIRATDLNPKFQSVMEAAYELDKIQKN